MDEPWMAIHDGKTWETSWWILALWFSTRTQTTSRSGMTIYQTPDFWTNASPHSDSSAPSCCGNSEVINSNDYSPALLGLSSPSMMSNAAGNIVDLAHPRQNHEGGLISSGYPSVHPGTGFLPPGPVPFPAHTASQSLFKPQSKGFWFKLFIMRKMFV